VTETSETQTAVESGARPERVIAVVGMHRSGTSALVGSLQQRGLFLGRHSTWNKHNLRGNRENAKVSVLNEQVLMHSGGSWSSPPAVVDWTPGHLERARTILAKYADKPLWGFKDPRTLLTLEGWLRLVPDLELVGVFRDPARVARSLAERPSLPVEDPIGLWRTYNTRLLELQRSRPFPLLCFDDEPDVLAQKLDRIAESLGLHEPTDEEPFFTVDLRRPDSVAVELPDDVRLLYDELRALAL
jgi:hypothetical protein